MYFENDNILNLNVEKDNRPLHERRWAEAKKKAELAKFKAAESSSADETEEYSYDDLIRATEGVSIPSSQNFGDSTAGKNMKFRPLVYYTVSDALNNCLKDFKDQAKANIDLVKTAREAKGQRLATKADLSDVLGEFREGRRNIKIGPIESVAFHILIREWCGVLCYFELSEANYGVKEMKRRGYVVEKVSVIYYQKNGVGLGKELILKQPFNTIPKHPAKNKK